VVDDDRTGARRTTFAELAEQTSRFAQLLRDLGVGAGERVLIRLANCLEYPVVFLGAMKRGAIPVPTSILLTSEEVVYLAADSGARVLVTDVASWNAMRDAVERLDHLTHALLVGPGDAARWPRLIAEHAATIFIGVPTIYRQIVQKTRASRSDVPSLRHCMSAGEHLSDQVLAAWRDRFGLEIYEGLGMTECSYYICQ